MSSSIQPQPSPASIHSGLQPTVSIVIPVFNEADIISELVGRLDRQCANYPQLRWEILFINDGSTDTTGEILDGLVVDGNSVSAIHLSRNFGHQIAMTAGLDQATGDAVIVMDGDLQDPPEVIPQLLQAWQSGYDVVYATRKKRAGESVFKRMSAKLYYRLLQTISPISIPVDTGDFRLMSRRVVDSLSQIKERNRFMRGLVSWTGFKQIAVFYDRDARRAGKSHYSLLRMIRLALTGLFSFSTVPLQSITALGFVISIASFLGGLTIIGMAMFDRGDLVQGWSSIMLTVMFLGGIQLICLGMIAEYLAMVFDEVRQRPLYLVDYVKGPSIQQQASSELCILVQVSERGLLG